MHPYVRKVKSLLGKNADPTKAGPMKKYMRDQFEYLGIRSPQMKQFFRQFARENGLPPFDELDEIVRDLWDLPQREYQYFGMNLMERLEKKLPETSIRTLEFMITHKSWWDSVDNISHVVGVHFRRYSKVRDTYLAKWRSSKNIWLRRTAILHQLDYKTDTDFGLLCEIVRENLGSDEFFINKAIGWALREYAKTDPRAVKRFVNATPLHALSRREALKHFGLN